MEIYFRGADGGDYARIDSLVTVRECAVRDTCGPRCDSLEIEFENAAKWYAWGPKEDDEILIRQDGYSTGIMFLNTIVPEDGRYRIMATALPCKARRQEWKSYRNRTVEDILRSCATRTGMSFQTFGMDAKAIIPYIQQENESAAAFLRRFLELEGAVLKCVNGNYTAIGLEYAQKRNAHQTIHINPAQRGTEYKRSGAKIRTVTVKTPYGEATAVDLNAQSYHRDVTISQVPAMDDKQAGRWARNILRSRNLEYETLTIESSFNPGMEAMTRVDITGDTLATGEWIITDAEHDLFNRKTRTALKRCVDAIQ